MQPRSLCPVLTDLRIFIFIYPIVFSPDGSGDLDINEFMDVCLDRHKRRDSNVQGTILKIVAKDRAERRRQKTALASLICRLSVDVREAVLNKLAQDGLSPLDMFEKMDFDKSGFVEKEELYYYLVNNESGFEIPPISPAEFDLIWPLFADKQQPDESERITLQSWTKYLKSAEYELVNFTLLRDKIFSDLPV
jgi:hypothetical protein